MVGVVGSSPIEPTNEIPRWARLPQSIRAFLVMHDAVNQIQWRWNFMVAVTLPDGSKREFDAPVRV